ncbi:MAG: AraC family transcriptional regulator, partial [Paenibacillaceae bacterium]|nr:AraC family transcriptional regulator [Paenibacillaceae bacterium]
MRKYFLSYLFIFSIPVLILGILMYRNTVVSLQQEIESATIYKLNQVQEATDRRMEELAAMAHLIAGDPQLSTTALRDLASPGAADNAVRELKRYTMLNIGLEDIVLYYRGQGSVYTSNGVSTPEHLADQVYQLEGWNGKQLLRDMNEIGKVTIRSTEEVSPLDSGSQKLLTYMFPIASGDSPPYGTAMFLIRESVLTDQIDTILNDLQGKAYILDENKTVLASKGALPGLNAADINRLLDERVQTGITQTRVKEQSYSVNQVTSDNSGWSFVTIMPTRQFLERVFKMRTFVLVILLFVILIGIAAAVVLSRRTYRPIRTLGDRNERLATQIDAQRPMMREHFLLKMLRGVWTEDEEIAQLMKVHEMEMNGPFFFVMLVSLGERRKDITAAQH